MFGIDYDNPHHGVSQLAPWWPRNAERQDIFFERGYITPGEIYGQLRDGEHIHNAHVPIPCAMESGEGGIRRGTAISYFREQFHRSAP